MYALLGVAAAGFTLAGVLTGVIVYLVREVARASTNERSGEMAWRLENQKVHDLELRVASLASANESLNHGTTELNLELGLTKEALRRVEVTRDELLSELAKTGDPRGVASRVAAELRAVTEMSRLRTTARTSGPGHTTVDEKKE